MLMVRLRRASAEWTPIYMLIVIAIAVVVIIAMIKPMFRRAQQQTGILQPLGSMMLYKLVYDGRKKSAGTDAC
jgi:hypothetical protein